MFGFGNKIRLAAVLPPLTGAQLRPRIKHINYLNTLRDAGVPHDQIPDHAPLCGELLLTYAFDLPDSFIMATPPLLRSAGIARAEVPHLARDNLRRALPTVKFLTGDGYGLAVTGGDMEATLLVLDGLWQAVQADIGGELLVAVPRRDRLLMCDSAHADAVAALRQQTVKLFHASRDGQHLSTQVMVRREQSWTLFEPASQSLK